MARSDKPKLSFIEPMECLLVSKLPEGPEWAYEIKLDGYRAQALCAGRSTQLLSRNAKDLAGACNMLVGSARSMGLEIVGE